MHIKTLKINDIIRIPDKSNGCIRHETNVTRMGKVLKFTHTPVKFTHAPKSLFISDLKKQRTINNKYFLFLKPYLFDNTYDFLYYGWFLSPLQYSREKENIIQNFLKEKESI